MRLTDPGHLAAARRRCRTARGRAPVDDPLGEHRPDARQPVQLLEGRGVEVHRRGRRAARRRAGGGTSCGADGRSGRRQDRRPATALHQQLLTVDEDPGQVDARLLEPWPSTPPAARTASATREPGEPDQARAAHGADHLHDNVGRRGRGRPRHGSRPDLPRRCCRRAAASTGDAARRPGAPAGAARAAGWARHSSSSATRPATSRTSTSPAAARRLGTHRTRTGGTPDTSGDHRGGAGRPGTQPPVGPEPGAPTAGAAGGEPTGSGSGLPGRDGPAEPAGASPGVRAAASGRRWREGRGLTPRR